jgi:high affinity Mn2+ porin
MAPGIIPANTRGYVLGLYTEFAQPTWTLRFAYTMVTTEANGATWDERIGKANSQTLEFEKRYHMNGLPGAFRILAFNNNGKMGSYRDALTRKPINPEVDTLLTYGHRKFGFGLNAEQSLTKDLGVFAKLSYNDGKTQTWFFTEIDKSFSLGGVLKGTSWKRADDELGLAFVANGISQDHRDYLAAGGYGFIIGDGKLNYGTEMVAEMYYKINALEKKIWLSPGYQFIINPAYNKDRGPVNVFSVRMHVEF